MENSKMKNMGEEDGWVEVATFEFGIECIDLSTLDLIDRLHYCRIGQEGSAVKKMAVCGLNSGSVSPDFVALRHNSEFGNSIVLMEYLYLGFKPIFDAAILFFSFILTLCDTQVQHGKNHPHTIWFSYALGQQSLSVKT